MDATRFDRLAKAFSPTRSRRGLARLLTALPLTCPLATRWGEDASAAARRRRGDRRDRYHQVQEQRKKKKKKCAKTGQAPSKKRKKCCKGLVKDGAGRCAPLGSRTPITCARTLCRLLRRGDLRDGDQRHSVWERRRGLRGLQRSARLLLQRRLPL